MEKVKCRICGKEFTPAHIKTQLCSEECRKENKKLHARKQTAAKTAERREKNSALTRVCIVCGKKYPVKNWNQKMRSGT